MTFPQPMGAGIAIRLPAAGQTLIANERCAPLRPIEVVITAAAAGGDGIGCLGDGRVVLCEGALPGERVAVEVIQQRRDFARARVLDVVDPSPMRMDPVCPHVARGCGGCTWAHVRPDYQVSLKVDIVADALRRLGGLADVPVTSPPGRGRVPPEGYRTSLRLAVGADGRPAYRRRHSRDPVYVDSCAVAHPRLAELVDGARFPGATEVGLRVGARTGERVATPDRGAAEAVVPTGTIVVGPGDPRAVVHEQVSGRRWRISATSFFQPGPEAAEILVEAVAAAAGEAVTEGSLVVDLYAGVGLLGGAIAARLDCASLVAVESHAAACRDAAANLADLDARVIRGEVARVPALLGRRPDLVIADPGRTGLGRSASAAAAALGAPVLVLVSCDPASLARDARLLGELGYRLASVEVLDLFPGTFHTEAVGRFLGPGRAA